MSSEVSGPMEDKINTRKTKTSVALLHPIQFIHCTSLAHFQVKSEIGLLLRFPIDCHGYSNLAFIVVFTATLYF